MKTVITYDTFLLLNSSNTSKDNQNIIYKESEHVSNRSVFPSIANLWHIFRNICFEIHNQIVSCEFIIKF